ncbi:phenylalanyl-tRNA synthetase beta chain [Caldicoprobacter guelmensis]|uniref:phenylalanine--tRNA ligase subunit beta n=1 Tax=Caldicoprobacter guelmensis TaxID=1170224 RepID=UPI00195E7937|nr:phenylalanine--tRNA ligase subunit beta [Caldicoprobacter guelmensis]MBM7582052.1 phenylalanyl-tRNA synthetase beta chain [Caldicoprobacter guelmensis]
MLVPLKWLKEYVKVDVPVEQLAHRLTMTGTKVESITRLGEGISNVVVGKILEIKPHPNADKLVVCVVDVGKCKVQIVTGAPNVKEGQLVPVALDGATLPGGYKITATTLRGVESQGMLCSGEELGLTEEDYPGAGVDGILILQEEYPLGMDIKEALGLDDHVLEFEVTSNRPDCLSVIGIAREASVALNSSFTLPHIEVKPGIGDVNAEAKVVVEAPDLCPRYCARVVKDVKIGPSPRWMQRRLISAGVRPINNIVDITNYVMLEMGQPMHAFDLDKVAGRTIVVRTAREGERLVTLDDKERVLSPDMLVIADVEKPIGLAGVMGGANTEITDGTRNILLESALFDRGVIRQTAKALGIRSEASLRFEKGLDIHNARAALDRAVQLIQELGIGTVVEGVIDVCHGSLEKRILEIPWKRVNSLLGLNLSADEMADILARLEFKVEVKGEYMRIEVPSFRQDIEGVADIAEEVARIYGYNNIPMTLMEGTQSRGRKTRRQKLMDRVKDVLVGTGLYEVVTYSFTSPKVYGLLGITNPQLIPKTVRILNPLGEDQSIMRTTLIPSLLEVLSRNRNRGMERCQIFEIGPAFLPKSLPLEDLPEEKPLLTIAEYGLDLDYYDLKGKVEVLLDELGLLDEAEFVPHAHPTFHPGRTALLKIKGKGVGLLGEIHPKVAKNFQLEVRVLVAELELDTLLDFAKEEKRYRPLPKYPAVERDLALVVKKEVLAAQVENCIKELGGELLERVELFDVYEGRQIPEGYKSIAYSLSYRAADRTLTDEEVNSLHDKIVKGLEQRLGARLR